MESNIGTRLLEIISYLIANSYQYQYLNFRKCFDDYLFRITITKATNLRINASYIPRILLTICNEVASQKSSPE